MYTQCPDCATVFRVTADALRTAQGNVRCGVCSTSFNALENLSEEPFRATPEGEEALALEDTITVEEVPGNENIELSTAAEGVPTPESAAEVEAAGPDSANEQSFEFDASAEDLDRLFVEMPATNLQHLATAARSGERRSTLAIDPGVIAASLSVSDDDDSKLLPHGDERPRNDLASTDEFPILILDESDEDPVVQESAPPPVASSAREPKLKPRPFRPNPFEAPRIVIPDEMRKGLADEAAAIDAPAFDDLELQDGPRRWPWTIGVAILMLTFAAQVVYAKREDLLRKPAIGPLLAEIYSFVGMPLSSPTDLSAYELRQWGAASDATQAGR
ncbi:MAG: MJ0042-type zinc finger domain-containing protein, partial [Steroidobacteraceae bacterium]